MAGMILPEPPTMAIARYVRKFIESQSSSEEDSRVPVTPLVRKGGINNN